jgi:shikimate dehydrogenase
MIGDILDGKGFVAGLLSNDIDPKGKRVLLAGAGGAANAIAFALAEAGVAYLGIHNRTTERVHDMIRRLHQVYPNLNAESVGNNPVGYDLLVNATSLGMKDTDPLPVDIAGISAKQVVAEIIMKPEITALLAQAQAKGCKVQFGLPMLRSQATLMAKFMGISD